MSLNWDLGNIKDFETVCFEDYDKGILKPKTNVLIWMCLYIDIGTITEKNVDEFTLRARTFELAFGARLRDGETDEPIYITREDVQRHVGLRTNVFPKKSDKAFKEKVGSIFMERAKSSLYNEQKREKQDEQTVTPNPE